MSVVELHEPLRLERDPFAVGAAGVHISRPLRTAYTEIMHHIGARTPVILVTGGASTGKTLLVDMAARASAENGLSVRRVDRGDLLPRVLGEPCDVLLIDEANSVSDSLLDAFSEARGKTAGTTVFLGLPSCLGRVSFSKLRPVLIELAAFPASDSRSYLLELAKRGGLPNLFTNEALDLIVDGSQGSPRLLRSLSSLAYFGAVSDHASQISSKYANYALVGQVPSIPPNLLAAREPAIVRAHEVPVRQKRPTEIPAYIRRATSDSLRGLSREEAPTGDQQKRVQTRADKDSPAADRKPPQEANEIEPSSNIRKLPQQANPNVEGHVRQAETPDQQQSAPEIPSVAEKTESIKEPLRAGTIAAEAIEVATDARPGPDGIEPPASELGAAAEQQNIVALPADTQRVIEIIEQSTREEAMLAEQSTVEFLPVRPQTIASTEEPAGDEARQQNPTDIAGDGDAQGPGIEGNVSDEAASGPEDDKPAKAHADSEGTEDTRELTHAWSSIADKAPLAIPKDSEAAAEPIAEPEDAPASAQLSARLPSGVQLFAEAVSAAHRQQRSTRAAQFQTTFVSSKPAAPPGGIPSNLKYLGIAAVCILLAGVAVIAAVVPSMLKGSNSDIVTLPMSAPAAQTPAPQTPSVAAPTAALPAPASTPAQSVPQTAPVAQSDIALAARETGATDAPAKSAAPAASEAKRQRARPLTDEEQAAVARGIQELERAARRGPPRR